jgi:hypothetical protein
MRRAGIPQVVRMKISGHKTDSMERRYNIVDAEDLTLAKELLGRRMGGIKPTNAPERPPGSGKTSPKDSEQQP